MIFYPGHIYHVYNQGNNKEKLFFEEENYLFFLRKMKSHLTPHVHILAWCLMPNHFHWLIKVKESNQLHNNKKTKKLNVTVQAINRAIGILQSSYTRAINNKHNRSGSLFRAHTKEKPLSSHPTKRDPYGVSCFFYLHQNPLRAGLVKHLEDWPYSSFRDYAGFRNGTLCNKKLAIKLFDLPQEPKKFYNISLQTIPEHIVNNLS